MLELEIGNDERCDCEQHPSNTEDPCLQIGLVSKMDLKKGAC